MLKKVEIASIKMQRQLYQVVMVGKYTSLTSTILIQLNKRELSTSIPVILIKI